MILENSKIIDAPLQSVWAITRDVTTWPEWTPTVTQILRLDDAPLATGSVVIIKQPGMSAKEWCVTEFWDGRGFTWETDERAIHMSATHELIGVDSGTKSTLRLRISGCLAMLLWPLIYNSARKNLELENIGLKMRCEAE